MDPTDRSLKRCCRCKAAMPLDCFHRNRSKPDGLSHICKPCVLADRRGAAERNRALVAQHGVVVEGTKRCCRCRVVKPMTAFPRTRSTPTGRGGNCKACGRELAKIDREQHPEKYRERNRRYRTTNRAQVYDYFRGKNLEREYGITLPDYLAMFDAQNGCCAICHRPATEMSRAMHVDHDHATGKVRALLCDRCNPGLGHFNDNIETLLAAIEYLRAHQ